MRKENQQTTLRVNDRIRFSPLRVIDAQGQNLGIISKDRALYLARESGLDLVEVVPHVRPPVCRIVDYGKLKYEQSIKEKKQRQKITQIKEVRFRPSTGSHDIETKIKAIHKFIDSGHKVRIRVKFEKRENAHKDLGFDLLNCIIDKLKHLSVTPPKSEGRDVVCLVELP